jgi:hypothetical protein
MWHYRRDHADRFDADVAAEALDETLERAAWRALQSSPGPRVAIGISGGLDSRVAAWYLKRAGADLTGYFFGEVGTEAHRAASDVASTLCIPLVALGCNRTLPHYFSRLLEARPLANLEWAKYATGRHKVDETDAIASGHLGDLLFGSHLGDPLFGGVVTPPGGESDAALARFTLTQMFADDCPPDVRTIVEGETAALCREVGGSALQRISAVWYRSRSMSIKNAPLFHDFDVRPHLAIFADIDVINLCLRLPRPALIGKGFYKQFIARRMPEVSPERVIPPVQRTHKPIESWLLDNSTFAQAVRCLAPTPRNGVRLNGTARHLHEAADAIIAGAVNRQEIHRFFRAFTIEAFVERWLSS